ncbi:hypothetical protein LINPERHAP1_LOCUS9098 [Linum perenne]
MPTLLSQTPLIQYLAFYPSPSSTAIICLLLQTHRLSYSSLMLSLTLFPPQHSNSPYLTIVLHFSLSISRRSTDSLTKGSGEISMKQSPVGSRTKSSKGFKVKHFMQTFLLLVISVWLIYQLKHSYDKKEAALRGEAKAEQETIFRLGRKDLLHPIATTVIMGESSSRSTSSVVGNGKQEMDVDQVKIEDIEREGRSSGDDVERTEEEESEEVEDHIDVDDTESGGKGNIETDDNTGLLGNEQDDDDDDDDDDELKAT